MAGSNKPSKNNPANRSVPKSKMVTSSDCELCKEKCKKGEQYLKQFNLKKVGKGVICFK